MPLHPFAYLDQLIADCLAAKTAQPVHCTTYDANFPTPANTHAIYIITEIGGDPEHTFSAFNSFKKRYKDDLKSAQPNHPSRTLYVGSCTTKLHQRIGQHTTHCAPKTHALRLYDWFDGQYHIEIRYYSVTKAVLQLIEDNLAHQLQPAFGKRGSNNT